MQKRKYNEYGEKKRKLEYFTFGLKLVNAATPSGYERQTVSSLPPPYFCSIRLVAYLHYGVYRTRDFALSSLHLQSQISLGERSLDLILGEFISCTETYVTVAKLSKKASCAEC